MAEKTSSSKRSKSVGARINTDSKSKVESDLNLIVHREGDTVCFVNGGDKTDETMWDKFCLGVVSMLKLS